MKLKKPLLIGTLCITMVFPVIGLAAQKKTTVKKTIKTPTAKTVTTSTATTAYSVKTTAPVPKSLPMVLDFGRGICIPCKQMKPILEELMKEYQGKAIIRIIDIDKEAELTQKTKIRLIPTQIFIDANGKEIYRHEGFMEKTAIVEKLNQIISLKLLVVSLKTNN
jgi:thioredoxin 1